MKKISDSITRVAQSWIDRHNRSPRGLGFTVDDGLPDRGTRYGGAQTIHNTGTIDIALNAAGQVYEVWFRCRTLPFRVYNGGGMPLYEDTDWGQPIVAIEFLEEK